MQETMTSGVLSVTGLSHDGRGIGRLDGRVVFVSGLIPGDKARVRITRTGRRYDEGSAEELLEPSADRAAPFCPDAGQCGGCALQHMTYPAQRAWKRMRVVEALERIGRIPDIQGKVLPTIGMEDPFRYRHKVSLAIRGDQIGFYGRHSHDVVPLRECAVQPASGPAVIHAVRDWVRQTDVPVYKEETKSGLVRHLVLRTSRSENEILVTLVLACPDPEVVLEDGLLPEPDALIDALAFAAGQHGQELAGVVLNGQPEASSQILGRRYACLFGRDHIREEMDGLEFVLSAGSFFQINPEMASVLYRTAATWAAPEGSEILLDLYCGTGTISCYLAQKALHVIGIESSPQAVDDARENAERNGLADRLQFIQGRAEDVLPELPRESRETVVLDPPRKGCAPELLAALCEREPERIVYVSCDPATLARDVRILGEAGYSVENVQPVDLFPWTTHVETVALITRK